ncbi:MAG: hypothetical protein EOT05_01430 [Candidatus Microsaccharimonas sossegonensis]|uniref:Uncharacterized protein n=1 Tax=Candidatus Microsaccharimonas sossegonensis TaxID=2506948 RepID=A0A4Q0AH34_9BACT|nr:MAG: hypothetical protein EOT05_01430 [Candidatus Microsaccharimonas sossegonensis]
MDITPQDEQQPMSDDQELAKALAGVLPDMPEPVATAPEASAVVAPTPDPQLEPANSDLPQPSFVPPASEPNFTPSVSTTPGSSDLDDIKKTALGELRPLIDKVDLPAEERFDTYLMLIRSTDDSSLIAPAHAAAQGISDETRRAQALLDIIKEIDYLSRNNQAPTA